MKRKVRIIKIDKKTFRKFVDHMVLEAENDKEFKEALKWLDRTKLIKGDFYPHVGDSYNYTSEYFDQDSWVFLFAIVPS